MKHVQLQGNVLVTVNTRACKVQHIVVVIAMSGLLSTLVVGSSAVTRINSLDRLHQSQLPQRSRRDPQTINASRSRPGRADVRYALVV